MKFKALCLAFTSLISSTTLAGSPFPYRPSIEATVQIKSASEVAVSNKITPIQQIHREAKIVISNRKQQKNQAIALTLDDDYDGYDYFNSYDVPVHPFIVE